MERQAGGMALMPWHKKNELSTADIGPTNIIPSLSNCETSVIEDGGDAKQLAQGYSVRLKRSKEEFTEFTERDDLTHVGGGFPVQHSSRALLDGNQADIRSESLTELSLQKRLRNAMIPSIGRERERQSFVPVDDLDSIINTKTLPELERLKIVPEENLRHLADQICERHEGRSPQDDKITLTSRRRFFATLVLIEQTSAILEVIEEGLYDWDLPLTLDRSHPGFPQLVRKGTGDRPEPVAFSQDWPPFQHESFFHCQWKSLSPYIEMRAQVGAKINHYPLDPSTILPITTISGPDRRGGFGSVSKIEIHPAHRNSLERGSESWLALKRLHYSNEQAFRAEVGPLKRLGKDHPHLIQLLATYQYGEDYYLLFPWADGGNLDDFFSSYPLADCPPRDPKLSKWLASQLSGLFDALASIHNCELDPSAANMSSFNSEEVRKKYGTHGDLKPENILWFKKSDTGDGDFPLGTFQISDFGLASFHGRESRQKFKPSGISATYRAPEYDINGRVSQQYDMWSLGCVLTELVTWYLLGGTAVNEFRKERLEDTTPGMKEDIFFSLPDHPDYRPPGRATTKRSVCKHLDMLRNLPGCTDFLLDLINFVDKQLLRMGPEKRCQVPQLLQFAKSISKKCHEEDNYCLERIKPIESRQGTNLSELVPGAILLPMSWRMSSPNSSVEALSLKLDIRPPRHNIMQSDTQDLKNRRSSVGLTKLSLEMRQSERVGSVSIVPEVETPVTSPHHEEDNGQYGVNPTPTPKFGDAKSDEGHSRDLFNVSTSTLQQDPKAKYSGTVDQTNTARTTESKVSLGETSKVSHGDTDESLVHQGGAQALPELTDKGIQGERYTFSLSSLLTTMSSLSGGQSNRELVRLENDTDKLLRRSMHTHMDDMNTQISQRRVLQDILKKEAIMPLFRQYKASMPSWQNINVDELCNDVHQNHIIVLAVLILFRMGNAIVELRKNGVSDAKLPLTYTDVCADDLHLQGEGNTPLECFHDPAWTIQMKKDICRMQWHLDVPFLRMGVGSVPEHADFRSEVVLPWCRPKDIPPYMDQSAKIEESGGYSRVRLVHIHPEYHGFHEILNKIGLRSCSNNFALKILNPESNRELDKMYQNEIKQLKSFNGTIARHLVTLLTTFTHKNKRHFLFPWANCDLFSYWDTEKAEPRNRDGVRWLSKQLMGIVEAVQAIHCPPHLSHQYGRHGDLKPDNILWYKQCEDDPKGILVVSDMGFTVAHRTWSRSNDRPSKVARTPDYRPPEIDTRNELVSRKYDVWTLGCIFLEMLTWFLGGREERKNFKKDRETVEPRFGGNTYTFFTLVVGLEDKSRLEANVKQSVLDRMDKVRNHKDQSHFTGDVVNIIQKHMILVNPSDRADMQFLQDEFIKINKKCQNDLGYCTTQTRPDDV
ncbi:hypothetical protein NUW58_g2892 [Xylaria curta]|uniref:Uncharacterized protein n=1 Tax=Xylaria curta TaxID=42375 RepID=A0ACC1PDF2_9PEZI|nr:hypothetical protein NUW58_g2892 [Xylaria curta]